MASDALDREVGELLLRSKTTIAVAESCTGGLVCHRLTNLSGSSDYLERGLVTYSNRSKIEMLGVPAQVVRDHGAVSEPCVRAMAVGVKALAGTDLGLAVSGIAGPTGGTPDKPAFKGKGGNDALSDRVAGVIAFFPAIEFTTGPPSPGACQISLHDVKQVGTNGMGRSPAGPPHEHFSGRIDFDGGFQGEVVFFDFGMQGRP